jgi:hypothetical protein
MKRLISTGCIACAFLAGCSHDVKPAEIPYTDQRSVAVPPAKSVQRPPDALVRVCEFHAAPGKMVTFEGGPRADAKLLVASEVLVCFGTPFYVTVALPEQRFEVGGVVHRPERPRDTTYRIDIGYADNARINHTGITSNVMLPMNQARVILGGTSGRVVTLVLEPPPAMGKRPATRP